MYLQHNTLLHVKAQDKTEQRDTSVQDSNESISVQLH